MSGLGRPVLRRVAVRLVSHAASVLPRSRREWANAMNGEVQHIPHGAAALKWACGCVLASYAERMKTLGRAAPRISRGVLMLEMVVCFTPLTLLFMAITVYFARFQISEDILYMLGAVLGPAGLIVTFKTVVLNRPSLPKPVSGILCMLAIFTPVGYVLQLLAEHGTLVGWWREVILIAILPALAAAHLILLARSSSKAGEALPLR